MYEMLVLYRKPDDPDAFEKRYLEGHLPLVRQYANIKDVAVFKVTRSLMGEFPYAYVFRGTWADKEAWKADMGSDMAKRATADADEFVKGLFDVVVTEQIG